MRTMTPSTVERVPSNTAEDVNRQIAQETNERVRYFAANPSGISHRLRELDEEWDIERLLEANASALTVAGVTLGVTVDKRWFALPALVGAFLFQHAIQGWCPPIPILRRRGYRTAREIEIERITLKALRGDFAGINGRDIDGDSRAGHALEAARI